MDIPMPAKITLEEITQRKKLLLEEIHIQKQILTAIAHNIATPGIRAASKAESLIQTFRTGMTIFNGIMTGIKLMRKLRRK